MTGAPIRAHLWAGSAGTATFGAAMESASKSARHVRYAQVVHGHVHGDDCNENCTVVEPTSDVGPVPPSATIPPEKAIPGRDYELTEAEQWALRHHGTSGG